MKKESYEDLAKKILNIATDAADPLQQYFGRESYYCSFIDTCCEAERKGAFECLDSPLIVRALEKARDEILDYLRPRSAELHKTKECAAAFKEQLEFLTAEHNRGVTRSNNLQQELRSCHFWETARKRELREEIEELRQPLQLPEDLIEGKKQLDQKIERMHDELEKYHEAVKSAIYLLDNIIPCYCPNANAQQSAQKPQKGQQEQKAESTTSKSVKDILSRLK